jgi:hypothetical protein
MSDVVRRCRQVVVGVLAVDHGEQDRLELLWAETPDLLPENLDLLTPQVCREPLARRQLAVEIAVGDAAGERLQLVDR